MTYQPEVGQRTNLTDLVTWASNHSRHRCPFIVQFSPQDLLSAKRILTDHELESGSLFVRYASDQTDDMDMGAREYFLRVWQPEKYSQGVGGQLFPGAQSWWIIDSLNVDVN